MMLNRTHSSLHESFNVRYIAFHITDTNSTTTTTEPTNSFAGGPFLLLLAPFLLGFTTLTAYLLIRRRYYNDDDLPNRRLVNGRSPSNYLYGNWQFIEKLPTPETENVCPICFSSLFPETSDNTLQKTSSQKSPNISQRLDKVIVSMNPMNAERLIEEQSHSPPGSPKSSSTNTTTNTDINTNANTTINIPEPTIESPPLPPSQLMMLLNQSSIQVEGPVVILPCHHCYHETCIKEWCTNHGNCPVCRYKPPNPNAPPPTTTTSTTTTVSADGTTTVPHSDVSVGRSTGIHTTTTMDLSQNTTTTTTHTTTSGHRRSSEVAYASPAYYSLYRGMM